MLNLEGTGYVFKVFIVVLAAPNIVCVEFLLIVPPGKVGGILDRAARGLLEDPLIIFVLFSIYASIFL